MISSRMSQTSGRSRSTSFLGRLDRLDIALLFELHDDERLEQLERHVLRQTALVQLQFRSDHDHRTTGIVDALAEQVLAETSLLALEQIGERLERALGVAAHRMRAATVVEQRVDRFLKHALFVAQNDFGSVDLDQFLQPVVAVDHAAIEIVEIRCRKATAFERHQRAADRAE